MIMNHNDQDSEHISKLCWLSLVVIVMRYYYYYYYYDNNNACL